MIIDSHAHAFPFLGAAPGFESPSDYFSWLQYSISNHHQPVRRMSDHSVESCHTIWSKHDSSPAGRENVDFRVGEFGRFEWTKAGIDYYKQYFPPSLEKNSCSADYLIAEMDYAGVDVAVLQNDVLYGKLNDFFSACDRRYPGRFLTTAHVDETSLDSHEASAELCRAVEQMGHRGVFVNNASFWLDGYHSLVDDVRFDRFWTEVERLKLVVYWSAGASPLQGMAGYLDSVRRWYNVVDRHPAIATVIPNGLRDAMLFGDRTPLPSELRALVGTGHFCIEVLFPIRRGGIEAYPYPQSLEAVRYLYETCGPEALVWGSDVPNVLRHCTYSQSLIYLRDADFIPAAEMDLILGGNLARLFRLPWH